MPDLDEQLRTWTDQAEPITAEEARTRASEPVIPFSTDRRHRGVFGSPGRRLLVAAAVVLVVAGGVFAATQVGDSDEVRVGEQPQQPDPTPAPDPTQPAPDPAGPESTPEDPPVDPPDPLDELLLTLNGPIEPADFDGPPPFWLGHDEQNQLIAVDTLTGEIVHVVGQFDRTTEFGEETGEMPFATGRFLGSFGLAPDRQTVFAEVCCEPAAGTIISGPLDGDPESFLDVGFDEPVAMAYHLEFSPDGTKVAVLGYAEVTVVDLVDRVSWSYPYESPGMSSVGQAAWARDGRSLVVAWPYEVGDGTVLYEVRVIEPGRTRSIMETLALYRGSAGEIVTELSVDLDDDVHIATRVGSTDPETGMWMGWEGPSTVRTVDPATADPIGSVQYEGVVVSQHHGADGTWTLLFPDDGQRNEDTGDSMTVTVLHDDEVVGRHDGFHSAGW